MRSTGGLAREMDLQENDVDRELQDLSSGGLVRMALIEKKGRIRIRWMITSAGRDKIK